MFYVEWKNRYRLKSLEIIKKMSSHAPDSLEIDEDRLRRNEGELYIPLIRKL
jgi:hypothetical protein